MLHLLPGYSITYKEGLKKLNIKYEILKNEAE
jgi:hypothetical protein